MKIMSIADIHGRPFWREAEIEKFDKVVFTGDYLDSHYYDDEEIVENFKAIIEFKLEFPEKIALLLGNHDIPYKYSYNEAPCSGFRGHLYQDLHDLFMVNNDLFQAAFQFKNHLWTHAGISEMWYKRNLQIIQETSELFVTKDLGDTLNHMLGKKETREVLFQCGDMRGGADPYGGIVWADRRETRERYLDGYHQIVGHTPTAQIVKFGDDKGSITYTDVLGKIAEIREYQAKEIKKWGSASTDDRYIEPTKFYTVEL